MFIQVAWHLGSECSLTEAWILCWLWRMSRRDSTKRCVPWMVSKTMTFLVPQSQAVKDTFWNWNRAVHFFEHVCPGTGQLSEKKEKTTWMLGDLICNHELLKRYHPKTNVKPENDLQYRNLFFHFQVLVFGPEKPWHSFFPPLLVLQSQSPDTTNMLIYFVGLYKFPNYSIIVDLDFRNHPGV